MKIGSWKKNKSKKKYGKGFVSSNFFRIFATENNKRVLTTKTKEIMSTRSCIIVKVRKEDLAKKMKFDASKVKLEDWGEQKKDEFSEEVELKSPYVGVYCHWDGYPEGVGSVLKKCFNDYVSALNLVLGGFISYLEDDKVVKHYANRSGEDWKFIKPLQGKDCDSISKKVDHQYCYLFTEEKGWRVRGWKANGDDTFDEF